MRRVNADARSLFSPADVPGQELVDLWGEEFDAAYRRAEANGLAKQTIPARDLYGRMMRTLAQTGNGWMTFKDAANRTANQTAEPGHVVHSSNLCTEILEVTDDGETAVCNLGSVNLGAFVRNGDIDWERLDDTVRTAVAFPGPGRRHQLLPDRAGGPLQRQVAAGGPRRDGLAGRLLPTAPALRLARGEGALHPSRRARHARRVRGLRRPRRAQRPAAGLGEDPYRQGCPAPRPRRHRPRLAGALGGPRSRIAATGLRNALLLAIAPTATIASIAGVYECIEPQVSNLFKRETLSGEFLQVNSYLVNDLKRLGVWDARTREALREANGSVQAFTWIPQDVRALYRTAWEIPQRGLIDMAAARTPFLDQSQSLNLFLEMPTIGKLSSMYAYAWKSLA
ncbi:Ribonucleoside-diphosphate reductase OS=Streptomyces alboniger OX=132473 GN=CP975_23805 PE=3 SV=1 [Streptomyces alboniger]